MALPYCVSPLKEMLHGVKLILTSNVNEKANIMRSAGLDPTLDISDSYLKFSLEKLEGHQKITNILIDMCSKVAYDKARKYERSEEPVVVIALFTVVTYLNELIGKPYETITNFRMLEMLNGKYHKVHTGCFMLRCGGVPAGKKPDRNAWRERFWEQKTIVKLKHMTCEMLNEYIALEEALYFPGGYNINGIGLSLVESIEGDTCNVRGFPLFRFCSELRKILEGKVLDNVWRVRPYDNPSEAQTDVVIKKPQDPCRKMR